MTVVESFSKVNRHMNKLRVAILGTGFMGRVHTEALRRLGNVEVVGVAGRTLETAQKFATQLGIERATSDCNELLVQPDILAVHICTPNSLHFPMAKAALEAGKHVLCEKPLALTSVQAQKLVRIALDRNLVN